MVGNPNLKDHAVKFGSGQPTNKGGAPKGKRISTIIKELLNGDMAKFDKAKAGMDANTALATELILLAFDKKGKSSDKLSAIKEILDRIEGKAVQTNVIEEKTPYSGMSRKDAINKLKEDIE